MNESINSDLQSPVPSHYAVTPDALTVVALAVPHTAVPQLLWPLLAGPIPPAAIITRTFTDVQQCAGTFKVRSANFENKRVVDLPAVLFASQLPHVSILDLRMTCLDADSFVAISAHLPQLSELKLAHCDGVRGDALASLPLLRSLRVLNLNWCGDLDVSALLHVSKCTSLEDLAAECCGHAVTERSLWAISENLTGLTSLDLEACVQTEASALCHIEKLRRLRTLNLCGCDTVGAKVLSRLSNLPALRTLILTWCGKINAAAVAHVSELPSLEDLHLDSIDTINAEALAQVAKLTRLRSLNLSHSDGVDAEALQHISKLPELTSLDLSGCCAMNTCADTAVTALASLPRLHTLKLSRCDLAASSLVRLCELPRLETLDLSDCDVDASVVIALAKLPRLRTLALCRCESVNAEVLSRVKGLSQLTHLDVSDCGNIDSGDLNRHLQGLPRLRTLIHDAPGDC